MNSKNHSIDMVNGPLLKNVFIFAVPLMLTNLLQMLFNAADTIVVGKFAGQQALAAVGATGSVIFLLTAVFNGLSMGSNVIIAQLLGSGDQSRISKVVHTSLAIAITGGIGMGVIGILLAKVLLSMMSTPSDIIDLSALYMRIYFAGNIFMLFYNFGSSVLRAKGDTKRPMYFLTISGVLNVLMNLIFVIFLHMSVAGVALATVLSQAVAAGLVANVLMHETDATRLEIKKIAFDLPLLKEILRIGIPAGIQGAVFSISNVVVQSSINSFGSSTIVAGNSAAGNIENFVYIGMMAFTQACMTFTGQNVGAKRYDKVKRIMWLTMALDLASALAVALVVWINGRFFLGLYTNDVAVIDVGMIRLTWVALFLVLNGVLDVFVSSMRGMGYSTGPTIMMLVGICGVRLAWLWIAFPIYRTLKTIYLCFPISWTVTSIIQGILWVVLYKKLLKSDTQQDSIEA